MNADGKIRIIEGIYNEQVIKSVRQSSLLNLFSTVRETRFFLLVECEDNSPRHVYSTSRKKKTIYIQ